MVFDFFHAALKASTPGINTSAQGVHSAFFIARHFVYLNDETKTSGSPQARDIAIPIAAILPGWFPWVRRIENPVNL